MAEPLPLTLLATHEVMKYGIKKKCNKIPFALEINLSTHTKQCARKFTEKNLSYFIERDDMICAEYLIINDPRILCSDSILSAIDANSIKTIDFLRSLNCPWSENTTSHAAYLGRLKCLKWVHENGCNWDQQTTSEAAIGGRVDCMRYARMHGCPWSSMTVESAAEEGQLSCMRYAIRAGCPWSMTETFNTLLLAQIRRNTVDVSKCMTYLLNL